MPRITKPANIPDITRQHPPVAGLQADLLAALSAATSKLTPIDLQRSLGGHPRHNRHEIAAAIRQLMDEGELNYINEGGRTLIELSFNRPVQVSKRIILARAGQNVAAADRQVAVVLQPGAAFGDGRHPSTRLALAGIEIVRDELISGREAARGEVLDIGTGSGTLVVAAVRLGFGSGVGLDIDPCALSEAAANVALNGLTERIRISDQPIDTLGRRFAMVCANLRWPTLRLMRHQIKAILGPKATVVLAGIKAAEMDALLDWYAAAEFICRWHCCRNDWAAVVLQRADGHPR